MTLTSKKVSEEAYAYAPGLKVKRAMAVTKARRLPIPGEVCVKKGDEVDYGTVIAKTLVSGDPEIVKVAAILGFSSKPADLPAYMKKKVGDKVEKDEIIAGYSVLFGLLKKWVQSPIDGVIELISTVTGQVVIRGLPIPVEVDSYIPGKVVEVLLREGAVLETNAAFIQGIFGIGGESHGIIKMGVESPNDELTQDHIKAEHRGMVLVGGSMVAYEALRKAAEVGVSCVVSGGIRHNDIKRFMGEEIGVAITGQEEVGLSIIITEGFGRMKMSQRTFDLLKSFEGYNAAVNGSTQIRAGVLRPEIIIPHGATGDSAVEELASGMVPGTPIRVIRQPYFGAIGKVANLPVELQQIQTRSRVRVLDVKIEDGKIVTVPRANVEIIEE